MKNILLVLSTTRQSPKTIELALEKVKTEESSLSALFVLDSKMPGSILEKLTDSGFTGEKPSQELHDSILSEYRERGKKKLEEVEKLAKEMNIPFTAIIREGDFTSECLAEIKVRNTDTVITTRKKRSTLSRFIFGSPIEQIRDESKCEMIIVEE
ncbi:MAG: universal stress protein [bacterium]|nr:universal stress protein [bacterium]